MNVKKSPGQSLLEVLIVLALVGISLITLLRGLTGALGHNALIKENTEAEHYAKELMEWVEWQRGLDWDNLADRGGANYCFTELPQLPDSIWPTSVTICGNGDYIPDTYYHRMLVVGPASGDPAQIQVKVRVYWGDSETYELTKIFSDWR